jgi:Tripartite tricarboxylate transporter family receptor
MMKSVSYLRCIRHNGSHNHSSITALHLSRHSAAASGSATAGRTIRRSICPDTRSCIAGPVPPDNVKGLIAWLKANPDKATQGNPTAGGHVAGAYFQKETGTHFTLVPYRGAGSEKAVPIDRGQAVASCQRNDQIAMKRHGRARRHDQTAIRSAREGRNGALDLAGATSSCR